MHAPITDVVCIQGPTASGKSTLAETLAREFDGEIISADSMQIYRGMDIGTAKVPCAQRGVTYHCLDLIDPGQDYSAALFQKDAREAISNIRNRGKTPIICGGTGLYVQAALDDMEFAPGKAENPIRTYYENLAETLGADGLHALLREKDPASAELIHPNNVRRTIRAFEMLEEGESYAKRKEAFKSIPRRIPSIRLALVLDRRLLYAHINERVDQMIDEGLVDEVRELIDLGFRSSLTAMQAIGYKEIISYLDGDISLDGAIELIKQATRRYAKRQLSWLRRDQEIIWLHADEGITDTLVNEAIQAIEGAYEK